jgi:hypothetical protein
MKHQQIQPIGFRIYRLPERAESHRSRLFLIELKFTVGSLLIPKKIIKSFSGILQNSREDSEKPCSTI